MKKCFVLLFVFFGCSSPEIKKTEFDSSNSKIDSIIAESKKKLFSLDSTSKKTDSSISGKVEKTVKQITTLKEEVKQLKQENSELKNQINDANDVGKPYKLLPISNSQDHR